MGHCSLIEKNRQRPENDFFQNFLGCCTSTHRNETFLSFTNFHIFSRSEKSWGGQTKLQFSTENDATGQKKWLFSDFFFRCTSSRRNKTFLFLPKFKIFNSSEILLGGQKALQTTTTTITTTTNATDDLNTLSGSERSSD